MAAVPGGPGGAALRDLNLIGAVTLIAEVGDLTRFDTPRKLMRYLGLTPSAYSSGEHRRQGGITKAGNGHARRTWVEGAWAYRYPAKVSRHLQLRLEHLPTEVRAIAWKAQLRPGKRSRLLSARGKQVNQVVVAMAREMAAFAGTIAVVPSPTPAARARERTRVDHGLKLSVGTQPRSLAPSSSASRNHDPRASSEAGAATDTSTVVPNPRISA